MLRVIDPFIHEVSRYIAQPETEEIVHLGREDRHGDTCSETDDDGVRHELNDRTQMRYTHHNEQNTRHDGSDHQTAQTVLLDDAVDDDDERTRRTAYLHLAAAEDRDQQTGDDRRHQAFRRTYTRRYTESDGEGDRYNTYDDTCQRILTELRTVILTKCLEQLRRKDFFD